MKEITVYEATRKEIEEDFEFITAYLLKRKKTGKVYYHIGDRAHPRRYYLVEDKK